MPTATLQRRNFPKTASEWEQFYKVLAGRFTIDNINPMWPDPGALLHRYELDGRIEDWNTAQQRWCDYVQCGGFEEQLMHGTLQLPMDVLQAAHKRLFGGFTDEPSSMAIRAIGFALFNPAGEAFTFKPRMTWEQVCRHANLEHHKRQRALNALEDLLTELDS